MKRLLHRCGCCDVHYDPAFSPAIIAGREHRHSRHGECPSCGCYDYEEVYEDDVE